MFALDAYYRDQREVPEASIDVDIPAAIDIELALSQLRTLAAGTPIDQPVYDYATHSRTGVTRVLPAASAVIVEGLFAFYWPEFRELMHTRVFVALDHDECLRRRVERDVRERGRTRAEVVTMYERKVRPMYDQYVEPTRHHAHIVLDGGAPVESLAEGVLVRLPDEHQR